MLQWAAVDETRSPTEDMQAITARLAQLELTLLEVVTALGMLVGELALREDLALAQPGVVEEALERGWQALFGAAVERSDLRSGVAAGRVPEAEWADAERLAQTAGHALEQAMDDTGAAVGAVYAIDEARGTAELLADSGYPSEVMEQFHSFPLDADLPAATVATSRRPLWFAQRAEIVDRYPHLRAAHEQTEQELGRAAVQGAVVPLLASDRVAAVVIVGFTVDAASPDEERLRAVRERVVRALTAPSR